MRVALLPFLIFALLEFSIGPIIFSSSAHHQYIAKLETVQIS